MRELAAPWGDIGINVLGLLPERELPELEALAIARIQRSRYDKIDSLIIERYASARPR